MGDPNKMKSGTARPDQSMTGAVPGIKGGGPADKSVSQKSNMDFILDIPLEISVELGRTTLMINDLLKLGQGSVVELSKIAGETLEVLANQRLIARGEVVVINEKYGIRLTEIISPMERIERLR
jgi:flagellar motor switch protein FliN/FliY